jgi:hypothetical protein
MKTTDRAIDLAFIFEADLQEALRELAGSYKLGRSYNKYASFSLQDIQDIFAFLDLIFEENFKKAFKKLRYLSKECGLIPEKLEEVLWKIAREEEYDDEY